jgi:hypothetical protein
MTYYAPQGFASFGQGKIIGGVAEPDESVVRLTERQKLAVGAFVVDGMPTCTGTVIGPRTVLSAAHCSSVRPRGTFVVGTDTRSPVASARIAAVLRVPGYVSGWEGLDSLLVYLDRDLPVDPIGIGVCPEVGDPVQTAGFGRTDVEGTSNTGKWWLVETVRDVRDVEFAISSTGLHGMCNGDSGGPGMVMQGGVPVVVGTVSWGNATCTGTDWFKRVDSGVADWIRGTMASWVANPPKMPMNYAAFGWVGGAILAGLMIGMVVRGGRHDAR